MTLAKIKASKKQSPGVDKSQVPSVYMATPADALKAMHPLENHVTGPDMFIKRLQQYYDSLDEMFPGRS